MLDVLRDLYPSDAFVCRARDLKAQAKAAVDRQPSWFLRPLLETQFEHACVDAAVLPVLFVRFAWPLLSNRASEIKTLFPEQPALEKR